MSQSSLFAVCSLAFLTGCPFIPWPTPDGVELEEGAWELVLQDATPEGCAAEGEDLEGLVARAEIQTPERNALIMQVEGFFLEGEQDEDYLWAAGVMPLGDDVVEPGHPTEDRPTDDEPPAPPEDRDEPIPHGEHAEMTIEAWVLDAETIDGTMRITLPGEGGDCAIEAAFEGYYVGLVEEDVPMPEPVGDGEEPDRG